MVSQTEPHCWLQIQFELQRPDERSNAAETHAVALLRLYKHSLTLCKGLDPKEKAPGDDLIPMAVATLMAAKNASESNVPHEVSKNARDPQRGLQKRMLQVCTDICYCSLQSQVHIADGCLTE